MSSYEIPKFKIEDLMRALHPGIKINHTGHGAYCKCPYHVHKHESTTGDLRLYNNRTGFDGYICHKDGGGSVWDLLERYHGLPGIALRNEPDFDATILFVCDILGIEPVKKSEVETPKSKAYNLIRFLRKELKPLKFETSNEHYNADTQLYRGFSSLQWLANGVGILEKETVEYALKHFGEDTFEAAGIRPFSRSYNVLSQGVIIFRENQYGTPIGFIIRRYEEFTKYPIKNNKYYKTGNSLLTSYKDYSFGLNTALSQSERSVYITEGEFDAKSLHLNGIKNAVALGGVQNTTEQFKLLQSHFSELIYVSDGDKAGEDAMFYLAETYLNLSFLILPENTDPDTYLQQNNSDSFINLPKYTSIQLLIQAEPSFTDADIQYYTDLILNNPSSFDENNIKSLAAASGKSERYLQELLFYHRRLHADAKKCTS